MVILLEVTVLSKLPAIESLDPVDLESQWEAEEEEWDDDLDDEEEWDDELEDDAEWDDDPESEEDWDEYEEDFDEEDTPHHSKPSDW